ncbi:MAG: hypothetical protein R3C26_10370 [Calditrichia bacterium]
MQIFDLLGRRVATLARIASSSPDDTNCSGSRKRRSAPACIFYHIDAGEKFVQTRRMIFIR